MRVDRSIPGSWHWTTLGEVTQVVGGGTPRSGEPDYWHGDVPWITPADLSGYHEKTIARGGRSITEEGLARSAARLLPTGTVLFSSRAPIGYVAIAANPMATNQGFKSFVPPREICSSFLYYYLRFARSVAIQSASGTTFKELSKKRAALLPFPLAPLPEQHRIVAKIESLFARLDEGVAALKRAEAKLERYRASVLRAAVEGRLTERWRRENPPEETGEELLRRILAERRKHWEAEQLAKFAAKGRKPPRNWNAKYKEPVAPDTSGVPELPEGWCWTTVDELTAGNRTSAYGVLKPGPEVPGGIPLVRVGNIQNGVVSGSLKRIAPEVASRYRRTRLRGGELLITLVGAIGRTAVVPDDLSGANTARAVGVVPVSPMLDPRWMELWFRSPVERLRMIGRAHEVARKTLNLEDVRSATVALPPRCEQLAILLAVEKTERGSTPTAERVRASRSHAATLRESILKRAFEGRLVPQDPADEPASVLMERIHAGR